MADSEGAMADSEGAMADSEGAIANGGRRLNLGICRWRIDGRDSEEEDNTYLSRLRGRRQLVVFAAALLVVVVTAELEWIGGRKWRSPWMSNAAVERKRG
ncbi:hypothetical protein LXL04_016596 [Taraxacum kok-saghyz]